MKNLNLLRLSVFAFIFIGLGLHATGQVNPEKKSRAIFITGIAFDSKTFEPLPSASFRINQKKNFATNETGRFSFYGMPNDTVVFTYLGYQPTTLTVPDTLKSEEYVMGVFMTEQPVRLSEIIILRRMGPSSMIIKSVQTDQRTMDIAQNNVDKAAMEGLTKAPQVYDAEMNTRKEIRSNQIRAEYKGMLVTPENAVGLSTQTYRTFNVIYGTSVISSGKVSKEMISNNESILLLKHYEAFHRPANEPELKLGSAGKTTR